MANIPTIEAILNRWPSRRAVYEDARATDPTLEMVAIHRWFQRGSIPPKYDSALFAGAAERGISLHPFELANARAGHTDRDGHAIARRQGGGEA